MLKVGKAFQRLPIVVSPEGEFYTPTYPREYQEGHAIADALMGKKKYFFQKLHRANKGLLQREKWVATPTTVNFGDEDPFRAGWVILKGRPFLLPRKITPKKAVELKPEALRRSTISKSLSRSQEFPP